MVAKERFLQMVDDVTSGEVRLEETKSSMSMHGVSSACEKMQGNHDVSPRLTRCCIEFSP